MATAEEHLGRCVDLAMDSYGRDDKATTFAVFLSAVREHPGTRQIEAAALPLLAVMSVRYDEGEAAFREFVETFAVDGSGPGAGGSGS